MELLVRPTLPAVRLFRTWEHKVDSRQDVDGLVQVWAWALPRWTAGEMAQYSGQGSA